jgi:hypothetical protein
MPIRCPLIFIKSRRCTFSITTLFISEYFGLVDWIPKLKDLKTIGVYTTLQYPSPARLLVFKRLLENSPSEAPLTLFSLGGLTRTTDTICAFPIYSHSWSAKTIHESLVHVYNPIYITHFTLFFLSLSDEDVLRPAITSISKHFPQIEALRLVVEDPDIHSVSFTFHRGLRLTRSRNLIFYRQSYLRCPSFDTYGLITKC